MSRLEELESVLESPPAQDAAISSGPSPTAAPLTVHLLGAGKVGRAFLRQLADLAPSVRLVAVSDRSATVFLPADADASAALALAGWKDSGRSYAAHPRAAGIALELALSVANAELVVDATDSGLAPAAREASAQRTLSLLRRGTRVALAAKTPLLADGEELLRRREQLGANAALGGTGRALLAELAELRARAVAIACVPNATTTAILTVLERGGSLEEGLAQARSLGLLERDPAQDVDGRDAALKLELVSRLVFGGEAAGAVSAARSALPGIDTLDCGLLARRRARGATTRLVGRAARSGEISLAWEEVASGSPLAVAADRVVYTYELAQERSPSRELPGLLGLLGETRVHLGSGIGPVGAASALIADVRDAIAALARKAAR